jgi:hypothetical protein
MMTTFWAMTSEERRRLLDPDPELPYGTNARALAVMWADCGEDEILMRIKHADEIAEVNCRMEITIYKVRNIARRPLSDRWTISIVENNDG